MSPIEIDEIIVEKVDDHEIRIRTLEKSQIRTEVQLINIEKNQADLKATMLELNRDQNKQLNGLMENMSKIIENTITTKNKIKIIDRKEFWGVLAFVIGSMVTYLLK